jgi:glycerol-3-phosphate acyltransferase PlsY
VSKKGHVSETPATQLLRAHKIAFTEHPYEYMAHGGAQRGAEMLGLDPFMVIKTLVMQDQDAKPLIVLMHGNRTVSTEEPGAADRLPSRSNRASPRWRSRHSGYMVGGTSPFATRASHAGVCGRRRCWNLPRIVHQRRAPRLPDRHRSAGAAWHCWTPGRCNARWQNSRPGRLSPHKNYLSPRSADLSFTLPSLIAIVASYLIGSLSFAVIVSKALGMADPRSYGSKNPGATNVLRSGNKAAALATLLLDALKGWVPVFFIHQFGAQWGLGAGVAALAGLAAFLGHLYPVFFGFQGGKGVATAAGVLVGIAPWLGLATGATWLIIAVFFRYSSLSSLVAAFFAPAYYLIGGNIAWPLDRTVLIALIIMSLLLFWRHRENIRRLAAGTESKLGSKKKQD